MDKEVSTKPLNNCQYTHEKVPFRIPRSWSLSFPFHDVHDGHWNEISGSTCRLGYDYSLGLMIVSFLSDVNPAGVLVYRLNATEDGRRVVKDGCNLVLLDGRRQHAVVEVLYRTSKHPLPAGHLPRHLVQRWDGAHTKQAEVIKLSKASNTSSVTICSDSTFVDYMKALVICGTSFDWEFGVKFLMHP